MNDMLSLCTHLPRVEVPAGQVLLREGDPAGPIWVLVSGTLSVRKGGSVVNAVTRPGAMVGEVSLLLGVPVGATVETVEPSVLLQAADGAALLSHHPDVTRHVAIGLAERLNFVTSYLADLQQQYGDTPGISMVSDVLRQIAVRQAAPVRPGSARDPDPEY